MYRRGQDSRRDRLLKMKKLWNLIKTTFTEWSEDKAARLAAALSYYTIFSIPPLLVIVIAIAGIAFSQSQAQEAILSQIRSLLGPQGAEGIQTILETAQRPGAGLAATIIGIAILLIGASGVFGQLQDSLNTIWDVKPRPGLGIMGMLRKRVFSFTLVLGVGFLLLVSLVITTLLAALGKSLAGVLPASDLVLSIINTMVSFLIITLLFALTYKFVPDAEVAWKDVWLGAAVTSLLFSLGKLAIGIYLGNSSTASTFGAAASIILILLWVYYSAQILFLGAEFTQVYANMYGQKIRPDKDSVFMTEKDRRDEGIEGAVQAPADPGSPLNTGPYTNLPIAQPPPPRSPGEGGLRRWAGAAVPALIALGVAGGMFFVRGQQRSRIPPPAHGV